MKVQGARGPRSCKQLLPVIQIFLELSQPDSTMFLSVCGKRSLTANKSKYTPMNCILCIGNNFDFFMFSEDPTPGKGREVSGWKLVLLYKIGHWAASCPDMGRLTLLFTEGKQSLLLKSLRTSMELKKSWREVLCTENNHGPWWSADISSLQDILVYGNRHPIGWRLKTNLSPLQKGL